MKKLKLFSADVCPYAHRSRLVLLEKKIEFDLIEIDLKKKPDFFLAISPYGKVPVLDDHGSIVFESSIINEYIDEKYQNLPLLPKDPYSKALARIWIDYGNNNFNKVLYNLLFEKNKDKQLDLKIALENLCIFIENEAFGSEREGEYWIGDQMTLVDISFYPFFERICMVEEYRNFIIPDDCFKLKNWIKIMSKKSSVLSIAHTKEFYINKAKKYANV